MAEQGLRPAPPRQRALQPAGVPPPARGRLAAARPHRQAKRSSSSRSAPPWSGSALLPDLVLHDGGAPVDALLVEGIAAAGLVQAATVVPDHDVALLPLVLVLRRCRDHVGRELLDQRLAVGVAETLDAHDVVG